MALGYIQDYLYAEYLLLKGTWSLWVTMSGTYLCRHMNKYVYDRERHMVVQAGSHQRNRSKCPPSTSLSPDLSPESQPSKAIPAPLTAQAVTETASGTHLKGNEALYSVGSVQAVETIHPQSAFLKT